MGNLALANRLLFFSVLRNGIGSIVAHFFDQDGREDDVPLYDRQSALARLEQLIGEKRINRFFRQALLNSISATPLPGCAPMSYERDGITPSAVISQGLLGQAQGGLVPQLDT